MRKLALGSPEVTPFPGSCEPQKLAAMEGLPKVIIEGLPLGIWVIFWSILRTKLVQFGTEKQMKESTPPYGEGKVQVPPGLQVSRDLPLNPL